MDLCISIIFFAILLLQNETNFVDCSEFIILDHRNTRHLENLKPGLITVDIKNCSTNSRVVCDYNPSDDSRTFTPNQGYLINKVTKRDAVLWDSKDYGNQYGSQVFVGVGEKGNRVFRVYFPRPLEAIHLEPRRPLEAGTTKPRLVTLDIGNRRSTHEVDYEYDEKHRTHTFTPNKGYLIHDVMRKGKLMWECENGVYPETVLILPDKNGDPLLRFKFPKVEDTPEERFETDHRLINLDVDNTRPNPLYSVNYDGSHDDYRVIFEPKSVYKFKSVIVGTNKVWRANDKGDCAYKVIFVHDSGSELKLILFFADGSTRMFIKSYLSFCPGTWKEY
ncbi:hypothetical protein MACJ_002411 [Theileria orientalis]|uniref:Signal peptide-containing protein n=1 Tax=Theileria orientalis TaxID=68886 RepID=A0A976M612_THEOR|nr:hypothetical protein MACJ_002411 [Theileria orientalis]